MHDLENQLLRSVFAEEEYAGIEKDFSSVTDHIDNLASHIRQNILPYIKKDRFLDIGAGPGFITRRIAIDFKKSIALDPNYAYNSCYKNNDLSFGLSFVCDNFEQSNFEKGFDLIVCSHVLYHVRQGSWESFLRKLLSLLNSEGKALIAMVAASGKFHELCAGMNLGYSNATVLKSFLDKMGVSYTCAEVTSAYEYESFPQILNLIRMFAIDDCFSPEEYKSLSRQEVEKIEHSIFEFANSCYNENMDSYLFHVNEEYIQLSLS